MRVQAVVLEQLGMVADLDDAAFVQYDDAMGLVDVERRWATTKVVRPFVKRSNASWINASVSVSSAEVASSNANTYLRPVCSAEVVSHNEITMMMGSSTTANGAAKIRSFPIRCRIAQPFPKTHNF